MTLRLRLFLKLFCHFYDKKKKPNYETNCKKNDPFKKSLQIYSLQNRRLIYKSEIHL